MFTFDPFIQHVHSTFSTDEGRNSLCRTQCRSAPVQIVISRVLNWSNTDATDQLNIQMSHDDPEQTDKTDSQQTEKLDNAELYSVCSSQLIYGKHDKTEYKCYCST